METKQKENRIISHLNSDATLILRTTKECNEVKFDDAILHCALLGKYYAEISNSYYYYYIANQIVAHVKNITAYTLTNELYVKLNIDFYNSNNQYFYSKTLVPPNGTQFEGVSGHIEQNGMKISFNGSHIIGVHIGYYPSKPFDCILCLGSFDLAPPNETSTTSSTTVTTTTSTSTSVTSTVSTETSTITTASATTISTVTSTASETTASTTTLNQMDSSSTYTSTSFTSEGSTSTPTSTIQITSTSNNCNQLTDCFEEELCSIIFLMNGTTITQAIDCYELGIFTLSILFYYFLVLFFI
jgi:hypothetical protein